MQIGYGTFDITYYIIEVYLSNKSISFWLSSYREQIHFFSLHIPYNQSRGNIFTKECGWRIQLYDSRNLVHVLKQLIFEKVSKLISSLTLNTLPIRRPYPQLHVSSLFCIKPFLSLSRRPSFHSRQNPG